MAFMTDTPEEKPIAVPAYSSSGIFGEDVNDVRQQIAMQQQNNAMQFANMPRGRGPVYAAALAGQQLGGALESAAGYQDPRVKKAQQLKEAAQEVDSQGLSLLKDPDAYYAAAYNSLQKRGLYEEAAKVHDIMVQQDIAKKEAQAKLNTSQKGLYDVKDGVRINTATGETKRVGLSDKSPSQFSISLAPPGTKFKGGPGQITVDTSTEEGRQAYNDYVTNKGYVNVNELPSPPQPPTILQTLPGESEFEKTVGQGQGKEVLEGQKHIQVDNPRLIDGAERVLTALKDPNLISGPGADLRLSAAKALNIAGADNTETIANTQKLVSSLADNTLAGIHGSGLGTGQGFTDKDLRFLEAARSGTISFTREALANLARLQYKAAIEQAKLWNTQVSQYPDKMKDKLRSLGVNPSPVEIPKMPEIQDYDPKKKTEDYLDKTKNVPMPKPPKGMNQAEWARVWSYMTPEDKVLWQKEHQKN